VRGATASYKGYRLQALYTLWRVLQVDDATPSTFQPEGIEDLAVLTDAGDTREVIQVKARAEPLVFSSFAPNTSDSFFYRAWAVRRERPETTVTIASFGPLGQDLSGIAHGAPADLELLATKLSGYGFISHADARTLLSIIQVQLVHEASLWQEIDQRLGALAVGVDHEAAFDLLTVWLYQAAEQRRVIDTNGLVAKINAVGAFLQDRAAYHQVWNALIVPIESKRPSSFENVDHTLLSEEFYQGVAARYDHIAAGLDIPRQEPIDAITGAFREHQIVIVHAASGQGKSTLAYRYLHDHVPAAFRYQVTMVKQPEQAVTVARALAAHAEAIGIPITVYLDASSGDNGWPELVRQLGGRRGVRVLVTIREEDWRRSSLSGSDVRFSHIDLSLCEDEAHALYTSLVERHPPSHILDFDDAWQQFGRQGPLLEFVFLVTQGEALRDRLSSQLSRFQEEIRCGQRPETDLTLLRLASIAGAFGCHLRLAPLVEDLQVAAPIETVRRFEQEYLIRTNLNGALIGAVHPLRSRIIAALLTDPALCPWTATASQCLPHLMDTDIELFLLSAFSRYPADAGAIVNELHRIPIQRWIAVASICRALLWLGVSTYVDKHAELVAELSTASGPSGVVFQLSFDLADAMPGSEAALLSTLTTLASAEQVQRLETVRTRQAPKGEAFVPLIAWLTELNTKPATPSSDAEWLALAEVLFWLRRFDIPSLDGVLPTEAELTDAIESASIQTLSDLVLAYVGFDGSLATAWLDGARPHLVARFRHDLDTIQFTDDGELVTAHFLVGMDGPGFISEEDLDGQPAALPTLTPHEQTLLRLQILRGLFPDRERFATQGYGHRVQPESSIMIDDTHKVGVARSLLPTRWLTGINALFRGLVDRQVRVDTWAAYAKQSIERREIVVKQLQVLERALDRYFKSRSFAPIDADWTNGLHTLDWLTLLPRDAVDEWGFADEGNDRGAKASSNQIEQRNLSLERYRPYLDAVRNYNRALTVFANQAPCVLAVNARLGRHPEGKSEAGRVAIRQRACEAGFNPDYDRLSILNIVKCDESAAPLSGGVTGIAWRMVDLSRVGSDRATGKPALRPHLGHMVLVRPPPSRTTRYGKLDHP
jgi:hypothetical protein